MAYQTVAKLVQTIGKQDGIASWQSFTSMSLGSCQRILSTSTLEGQKRLPLGIERIVYELIPLACCIQACTCTEATSLVKSARAGNRPCRVFSAAAKLDPKISMLNARMRMHGNCPVPIQAAPNSEGCSQGTQSLQIRCLRLAVGG